jgi:(2Fe-2S) ferredoxin
MSKANTTVTPAAVVEFVERNTSENAKWCPEEEVLWVLSWYGETDRQQVQAAIDRAVTDGVLVSDRRQYAVPALADA